MSTPPTHGLNVPSIPNIPNIPIGEFGPAGAQPASLATVACQHAARRWLPMSDEQSFDDARRGFIADIPALPVTRKNGAPVWSLAAYGFLADAAAPASVHPVMLAMSRPRTW